MDPMQSGYSNLLLLHSRLKSHQFSKDETITLQASHQFDIQDTSREATPHLSLFFRQLGNLLMEEKFGLVFWFMNSTYVNNKK